jgi:hypothetical protein
MDNERSTVITIGGTDYELILTTRATKEIAKRYGGLSNLGDKLMKSENFEMALDEVVWLITLLANQSILIHNLRNPKDKQDVLTEEAVELLTSPLGLAEYKSAIMEAMMKGSKRNVESEAEPEKNTQPVSDEESFTGSLLRQCSSEPHRRGTWLTPSSASRLVGVSQAIPRHGYSGTGVFH